MKKNKKETLILYGRNSALILFWLGVIFYFSSMSGKIYPGNPPLMFYVERKGAHIAEYFILMVLFVNFLKKDFTHKLELILLAGALSLLYAISDEIHQLNVFGREGKIIDVGFDLIGITLAGVLIWFLFKSKKTLKLKNKLKNIFSKL